MSADVAALAILGLKPGADRAAIDAAYKRLIKLHHPDRQGGDSARAAEINRAYFELRRQKQERREPETGDLGEAIYARRAARQRPSAVHKRRSAWRPMLLLGLLGAGVAAQEPLAEFGAAMAEDLQNVTEPRVSYSGSGGRIESSDLYTEPLDGGGIGQSVEDARRLSGSGGVEGLADHSRECHRELRMKPSAALLDRCAAFDDAVVAMTRRDPLQDGGPFSASAVTARQMNGAQLLTDDYGAIETRLDQIRLRVDATLFPLDPLPSAQPAQELQPVEQPQPDLADQTVLSPRVERLPD